jgi:hypothetical protein
LEDGSGKHSIFVRRQEVNRTEALEKVAEAAREALGEFCEFGVPVLKSDSLGAGTYWTPAGRMMSTAPMMVLAEAIDALDATASDEISNER